MEHQNITIENRKGYKLHESWDHVRQNYRLYNKIGQGAYGEVVRAKNIKTAQKVAIKKQKVSQDSAYSLRKLLTELQILRQISQYMKQSKGNFAGVPLLIDVMQSQDHIFIITEYIESDLKKILDASGETEFGFDQTVQIFYNILRVVESLHSANIMHRDIKPSNILVNESLEVKICDFGISRNARKTASKVNYKPYNFSAETVIDQSSQYINDNKSCRIPNFQNDSELVDKLNSERKIRQKQKRTLSNHVQTRWYRAPEVILVEKFYDEKIDMWSLGCVFAEMILCCKEFQFGNNDDFDARVDRYVMPGGSCFPLSPCEQTIQGENDIFVARDDQLMKIIEMIGQPSEDQMCHVTEDDTIDFIQSVASRAKNRKNIIPMRFRDCPNEMIDLLLGMLNFNPHFRMSASECLKNRLFDKVRKNDQESTAQIPTVNLDGFQKVSYDFDDEHDGTKYTIEQLQNMVLNEIQQIEKDKFNKQKF